MSWVFIIVLALLVLCHASAFFFPKWHERRLYEKTINNTNWNKETKETVKANRREIERIIKE